MRMTKAKQEKIDMLTGRSIALFHNALIAARDGKKPRQIKAIVNTLIEIQKVKAGDD